MLTKEAVNILPVHISTKLSMQKTELFNSKTQVTSRNNLDLVSIPKKINNELVM